MATALYKFNGLTFDVNGQLGHGTKIIDVDASITTLFVQDAYNAIRRFEAARPNFVNRGTLGGPPLVRGELHHQRCSGDHAGELAGRTKHMGELFFLLPKAAS